MRPPRGRRPADRGRSGRRSGPRRRSSRTTRTTTGLADRRRPSSPRTSATSVAGVAAPRAPRRRRPRERPAVQRATATITLRKPWCSKPVASSVNRTAWCRPAVSLNGHAGVEGGEDDSRPGRPRTGTPQRWCRRCGTWRRPVGRRCRARRLSARSVFDASSSVRLDGESGWRRRHGIVGLDRQTARSRRRSRRLDLAGSVGRTDSTITTIGEPARSWCADANASTGRRPDQQRADELGVPGPCAQRGCSASATAAGVCRAGTSPRRRGAR